MKYMNILLYLVGVLFILLALWVKAPLPTIVLVIIGFVLIILSSLSSVVNLVPRKTEELKEEIRKEFEEKISTIFEFSPAQINSLGTPPEHCPVVIPIISEKIKVSEGKIKRLFESIESDIELKNQLDEKNRDIVYRRLKTDVGLNCSIYLNLKDLLEKSEKEELKHNVLKIIDEYSQRNSLNDFLACPEGVASLTKFLNILLKERDIYKFMQNMISQQVGIPHYENTIIAFKMAEFMLDIDEIKPRINKSFSIKILCDYFNLLLTELKLREIIRNEIIQIAEKFIDDKIKRDEALKLIMKSLIMYANTINQYRDGLVASIKPNVSLADSQ